MGLLQELWLQQFAVTKTKNLAPQGALRRKVFLLVIFHNRQNVKNVTTKNITDEISPFSDIVKTFVAISQRGVFFAKKG